MTAEARTLASLRRLLLILLGCGLAATTVELLLLGHDESSTQLIPLFVLGPAIATLVWHAVSQGRTSSLLFRLAMLALIGTAMAGVFFHYRGNMEFQLEMDASLTGLPLLQKVLHAKAPPALAPGHLALLGLFGLAATYRQPDRTRNDHDHNQGARDENQNDMAAVRDAGAVDVSGNRFLRAGGRGPDRSQRRL